MMVKQPSWKGMTLRLLAKKISLKLYPSTSLASLADGFCFLFSYVPEGETKSGLGLFV